MTEDPKVRTPPTDNGDEGRLVDSELHCPECQYNLTGLASPRCPWCGWRVDLAQLAASPAGTRARRLSAMAACVVVGVGSIASIMSLAWPGLAALSVRDGLAIIGAVVGALGHLYLAALLGLTRRLWPLRRDDNHTVLRVLGWFCIVLAVVGATPLLRVRIVRGLAVTSVFEFVLVALFYAMPGWTLLVMVMLAFRHEPARSRSNDNALRASGVPPRPFVPFVIDAVGAFEPDRIAQSWSDRPRPTTPAIEAAITRTWEAETAVAPDEGRQLYNGKLVRVQGWRIDAGRLSFTFGPTTFREFLGTNLHPDAAVKQAGEEFLANPLGVSATVITRDGRLAFGRRSDNVAYHAGFLHTFGGMLDENDRAPDGAYDVFGSIGREVCEELGVTSAQIVNVRSVALVRDAALRQPELLFDVTITLDATELESLFSPGEDGEHTRLELIEDTPEAAIAFLEGFDRVAPVAQAALLLHGRTVWGRQWYERISLLRYGEVPQAAPAHQT